MEEVSFMSWKFSNENYDFNKIKYEKMIISKSNIDGVIYKFLNCSYKVPDGKIIIFDSITIKPKIDFVEFKGSDLDVKLNKGMLKIGCKTFEIQTWIRWYETNWLDHYTNAWGNKEFYKNVGQFLYMFFNELAINKHYIYKDGI